MKLFLIMVPPFQGPGSIWFKPGPRLARRQLKRPGL